MVENNTSADLEMRLAAIEYLLTTLLAEYFRANPDVPAAKVDFEPGAPDELRRQMAQSVFKRLPGADRVIVDDEVKRLEGLLSGHVLRLMRHAREQNQIDEQEPG